MKRAAQRAALAEATVGLEPTVGVLQTPALPLGYVARERHAPFPGRFFGAGEGIRTLDLLLGKETFYH
jgi:hypothetical protein